jgi:hypothetical protein
LLFLFAFSLNAAAYEGPKPLRNVEINTSVSYDAGSRVFKYNYKFTNPTPNDGEVEMISFTISREIMEAELSHEGLDICDSHPSRQIVPKTAITAIGATAPQIWTCSLMPNKTLTFYPTEDTKRLGPGQSLAGFQIISKGLPSIRAVDAEPSIDLDKLPDKYEENDELLRKLEASVAWHGKTVGPRAPPRTFDAKRFADYLSLLNEQSAELKWIKKPELQQTFEEQLKGIKSRLAAKDSKQAQKLLASFLQTVKEQSGKGITPEAFALLYYNAQYLADHL